MIFLIQYDRDRGRIVSMRSFRDSDREHAEKARLALELDVNRTGIVHEVVILEAASEESLRRTHRRYFENVDELARSTNG
jgi:hypothetical protein